eukprot:g8358.t1
MTLEVKKVRLPRRAFDLDYTLSVPKGTCMAIMGANGSGKSSLFHLLSGFESPVSGSITFDDVPIHCLPPGERPLTILFQEHNLFDHLTVSENVALGLRGTLYLRVDERDIVQAILEKFHIQHLAHRKPSEVSGGEQQRTALARCILRKKPLLLLDEPFSALDPQSRYDFLKMLKQVHEEYKLTMLVVTHSPQEAMSIAPTAAFLHEGKVIATGRTQEVLMLDHPAVRAFKLDHDRNALLKEAS